MNGELKVLCRQRLQRRLGQDVFTRFQNPAGESADQKAQGFLLCFWIGKGNDNHVARPVGSAITIHCIALGCD